MKDKLVKRLTMYWQLELMNAAFLPLVAVLLSVSLGEPLGIASLIAAIPMIGLLVVGGLYWRAKLHEVTQKRSPLPLVAKLARWQAPLLIATIVGALAAIANLAVPGLRASPFDVLVAAIAAGLAVLEYVNYYHVQLQHFDNWADFRRLISGRGFQRSKLREDIERLR